jgi:FkbM family methyltransferase
VIENPAVLLGELLRSLPDLKEYHSPGCNVYSFLRTIARGVVLDLFCESRKGAVSVEPFGELVFPYERLGNVDSTNLFDLDELIVFSFYWRNRCLYRRALDVGANLGLHTIIMNRCGFHVTAFEPDPLHFRLLKRNLAMNLCSSVETVNAAVSSKNGNMEFVRVLGNTTSSHLAGSKTNPYGELDRIFVDVVSVRDVLGKADLVKLDVEGHEGEILTATVEDDWKNLDALVEIGTGNNARIVFEHMQSIGVNLFAQKLNWQKASSVEHVPTSYREGMVFLSVKDKMPW